MKKGDHDFVIRLCGGEPLHLIINGEIDVYYETQTEALEAVKTLAGWGLRYMAIPVKDGRWYVFRAG